MNMTTLETPRLRLRMFQEDDFDVYAGMLADPEVMRYLPQGAPMPPSAERAKSPQTPTLWSERLNRVPRLGQIRMSPTGARSGVWAM